MHGIIKYKTMRISVSAIILIAILFSILFPSLSGNSAFSYAAEQEPTKERVTSYKDIPKVTEAEIAAIESIKNERSTLSISNVYSSEAFTYQDGAVGGYVSLLSKELSTLFDIKFVPQIDTWEDIVTKLDDKSIDFSTSVYVSTENSHKYIMTEKLQQHPMKMYRQRNSVPIEKIVRERPLKFAFIDNGRNIAFSAVKNNFSNDFEPVYIKEYDELLDLFANDEIDAFISQDNAEVFFDEHLQFEETLFLPLIYNYTSIATADKDLEAFISVIQKYRDAYGDTLFNELFEQGRNQYLSYKLSLMLTPEENAFIREHIINKESIPFGPSSTNYPICFYNSEEEEFQGISIDVLKEISTLTGLQFEPVNEPGTEWYQVFEDLQSGRSTFVSELLFTSERKDNFLWTEEPYATDSYALLSRVDTKDITIEEIPEYRIGLIYQTGYANLFLEWFPNMNNNNITNYNDYNEAFAALEHGEIDFLMGTKNLLLNISNYLERPGYKANIIFNYQSESSFGFNKGNETLVSIFSKTQSLINTYDISSRWSLKAFDFRQKLEEERFPFVVGAVLLAVIVLLLLILLFIRNQSENKRLEATVLERTEELENQTKEAKVASMAKSDFLARMSHEIRTPLNAILGMATIAKNSCEPKTKPYNSMAEVISASSHLLDILNDILDMSKIESGKFTLSTESFVLETSINEVDRIINERCKQNKINFISGLDIPKDLSVIGDRLRLKQVLINLLGNAVKFTPETGTVTFLVDSEQVDNDIKLTFSVIDTGIGIKKDKIDKLFNSFEQADETIATRYGGTGLGLSISQNLVNLMGGSISIKSQEGKGSTFSFEICLPIDTTERATIEVSSIDNNLFSNKRILIVEDIEINRIILMELLDDTHLIFEEATDGEIAVKMFEESPPSYYDLIFMDIQMPNMDGHTATQRIRESKHKDAKTIPIIAMSANAFKEDIEKSLEVGMNMHLSKPIDIDAVKKAIWTYLK